jgi:hypothetical protein
MSHPGYWMYETTGVLKPAVKAYLEGGELSPEDIAALRAYLRQWIDADGWDQGAVHQAEKRVLARLRFMVDGLISRETIQVWLQQAASFGIDPL